jgi:hypothetical protein
MNFSFKNIASISHHIENLIHKLGWQISRTNRLLWSEPVSHFRGNNSKK